MSADDPSWGVDAADWSEQADSDDVSVTVSICAHAKFPPPPYSSAKQVASVISKYLFIVLVICLLAIPARGGLYCFQ